MCMHVNIRARATPWFYLEEVPVCLYLRRVFVCACACACLCVCVCAGVLNQNIEPMIYMFCHQRPLSTRRWVVGTPSTRQVLSTRPPKGFARVKAVRQNGVGGTWQQARHGDAIYDCQYRD